MERTIRLRFRESAKPGLEGAWLEVPREVIEEVAGVAGLAEALAPLQTTELRSHVSRRAVYLEPDVAMPAFLDAARKRGIAVEVEIMVPEPDWSAMDLPVFTPLGAHGRLASGARARIVDVDESEDGTVYCVLKDERGRCVAAPAHEIERYVAFDEPSEPEPSSEVELDV